MNSTGNKSVSPLRKNGGLENMAPTLPVIALFILAVCYVVFFQTWPSPFDEVAQLSAIIFQAEHPDLFADTRNYGLLRVDDLSQWSGERNYLNHPALYYLLLSPVGSDVVTLRLANAALAISAYLLILWAGCRILQTSAQRVMFAIVAACFPKFALVGGIINNDNLAMLAAGLVFAGLTGAPGGMWLIAVGLALAGWSKLTALIALGAVFGGWVLLNRQPMFGKSTMLAIVGGVVGALPFLCNFLATGALFHVNMAVYGRPLAERPDWNFIDYTTDFLYQIALKWPADEASLPAFVGAALLVLPLALAIGGTARFTPARAIGGAYLIGLAATFAFHFGFGWQSFTSIGDTTIAQTRYYNVLWPGLAFAATYALAAIKPVLRGAIIVLLVVPTVIGTVILRLIA